MKLYCSILLSLFIAPFLKAQSAVGVAQAQAWAAQQQAAFEENKGQIWEENQQPASQVQYHYQNGGLQLFLLPTGMAYQFTQIHYPEDFLPAHKVITPAQQAKQDELRQQIRRETYRMDVELVGANAQAKVTAEGKSADYVNYYNRNALDVHRFEQLTYQDIYPGIDWVIRTTDQGIKYDFVVQPGADPSQIQLRFKHHEGLQLNADGSFTVSNRMGSITEQAPVSFQGTQEVTTAFQLEENTITFKLGTYDATQALVIDPNLLWATYYGGSARDIFRSCSIDGSGNVYASGETFSALNIASGGHQNTFGGNSDALLVKFNLSGTRLWASYYGGTGEELGNACAVDAAGNVYLAGETTSSSNIAMGGHQNTRGGGEDAFIVKFNASGARLWASYYGGTDDDTGYDVEVDGTGNVYLVGAARSMTDIASGGHQNTGGYIEDAFIVKFNASGTRLWASYYGGTSYDEGHACAVDGSGNVYMVGRSGSTTNIASGGHQNTFGGGGGASNYDGFIVKFNSAGVRLWGSYYGGSNYDAAEDVAIDGNGQVYMVGITESETNIASGGHQNELGNSVGTGNYDGFIVKFSTAGVRLWGSYYGGIRWEGGYACSVDPAGDVYLIGIAESTEKIATGGFQSRYGGGADDAFIAKFNSAGTRLWASYYGGSQSDFGLASAVDAAGHVYLLGATQSTTNIASTGHQNTAAGGYDAFIAKFCVAASAEVHVQCAGSYTWLDGNTYTESNDTAFYRIPGGASNGCDSIVTLNLTIKRLPDNRVFTNDGLTYSAVALSFGTLLVYNYQWLDCNNGYAPIPGATNRSYTPTVNGDYAVAVTQDGCTDTSVCSRIIVVGVDQVHSESSIQLYPNPTPSNFTLDLGRLSQNVTLQLHHLNGQLLREAHYAELQQTQWTLEEDLPSGVYVLKVKIDQQPTTYFKIIKQ